MHSPAPAPADHAAAGDLLRVFAVFMVAWYHIWQQSWLSPTLRLGGLTLDMTAPVRTGYMFVDLMLVLSGFLVYRPGPTAGRAPRGNSTCAARCAYCPATGCAWP